MENIPCPECGAKTNGYCPNCQTVTAHVHQWRATPSIVKELQSLALGLAVLCEQPTTKVADVIKGLEEHKSCQYCHCLFTHTKDYVGSPFCCLECRQCYDDLMYEWGKEGEDLPCNNN